MISFGLIGVGHFGKNYLRILQEIEGAKLVGVAASTKKSLDAIDSLVSSGVKKTTSAEEIFRYSEIGAVIIATLTPTHFLLASAALKAGKHVHVEKPMTATLVEAEELARIVEDTGKIFSVGHQYLYNDHISFLKQKIDEGFLGTIRYIHAEHFYTKPLFGNVGCFWETATHELAIFDYLFGPFSIEKKLARFEDFFNAGRDDFANVSFLLSGKIQVTIITSWVAPEKVRKFTIVGEKGAAIFDEVRDIKNPLRLYKIEDEDFEYKDIQVDVSNAGEPLRNELGHFIECIRENREPLTGYRHGLRVTKYLDELVNG